MPAELAGLVAEGEGSRVPASGVDTWATGGSGRIVGAKWKTPTAIVLVGWVAVDTAAANVTVTAAPPAHLAATLTAGAGGKVSGTSVTFASVTPGAPAAFAVTLHIAGVPAAGSLSLSSSGGLACSGSVPLRVSDTLRPAGLDTAGFGAHWTGAVFTAQGSGSVPCGAADLSAYASMVQERCGLGHVDSIPANNEEIAASTVMGTQQMVLVHSALNAAGRSVTLTIKTGSQEFTAAVATEMSTSLA